MSKGNECLDIIQKLLDDSDDRRIPVGKLPWDVDGEGKPYNSSRFRLGFTSGIKNAVSRAVDMCGQNRVEQLSLKDEITKKANEVGKRPWDCNIFAEGDVRPEDVDFIMTRASRFIQIGRQNLK